MPHVSFVEPEDAEGQVKDIYNAIEHNFGDVLNLIKGLGNSGPGLRGFAGIIGSMDEFDLDPALRELAYLKASQINNCKYCLHYHSADALEAGLDEEKIQNLADYHNSNVYEDREKHLLQFAELLTRNADVDEKTVKKLKEHFSDRQYTEICLTVACANLVNRINHGLGIPLED